MLGDGFYYHFAALRLGRGLGYTVPFTSVSAPDAMHPPAWISLLGVVSALGGRSWLTHQLVGDAIGVGVVIVAGLVGRRYFDERTGMIAAALAAIYPGFWVVEAQVLSEPLATFLLGLFMLAIVRFRDTPTLAASAVVGAVCGFLVLTRSEQAALLLVVVLPVVLLARSLRPAARWVRLATAFGVCAAVLFPWTVYNAARFEQPVLLSTDGGSVLVAGNCGAVFHGSLIGYHSTACVVLATASLPSADDESEIGTALLHRGLSYELSHASSLPAVIPARLGRAFALFKPAQTVQLTAKWLGTSEWQIWLWAIAFWILVPLAVAGVVVGRRQRCFLLPLLAPLAIAIVSMAVTSGELRFHTPADLGVVVLAAAGLRRVWNGAAAPRPAPQVASVAEPAAV